MKTANISGLVSVMLDHNSVSSLLQLARITTLLAHS